MLHRRTLDPQQQAGDIADREADVVRSRTEDPRLADEVWWRTYYDSWRELGAKHIPPPEAIEFLLEHE